MFAQLPKALERHEALVCCTRNAIPGVPSCEPEREWVNGTYTVLSSWGPPVPPIAPSGRQSTASAAQHSAVITPVDLLLPGNENPPVD